MKELIKMRVCNTFEINKNKILKMVGSALNNREITFNMIKDNNQSMEKMLEVIYILLPFKIKQQIKKEEFVKETEIVPILLKKEGEG